MSVINPTPVGPATTMQTTRRYPRTMQEAFGPHTSRDLRPMPEPPGRLARWLDRMMRKLAQRVGTSHSS